MTEHPVPPTPPIDRRWLLRGGALATGAAGALALGALAPTAEAADGRPVLQGAENKATTTTGLSVAPGTGPTLALTNPAGPSLYLEPIGDQWNGELAVGEIAGTTIGPIIAIEGVEGPEVVQLATTRDLDHLTTTYALRPTRVLDTRLDSIPTSIVDSSRDAVDSEQRVKAGAWIDVAIAAAGEGFLWNAVFANLTISSPVASGFATAYPPGTTLATSTVNFQAGRTESNAFFVGLDVIQDTYAVRIWVSKTCHVILDVTGALISIDDAPPVTAAATRSVLRRRQQRQARLSARLQRSLGR